MKLTNEEIAKVFAMYWKCDVTTMQGSKIASTEPFLHANMEHQLILTPLSRITDEDKLGFLKADWSMLFEIIDRVEFIPKQKKEKSIANTGEQYVGYDVNGKSIAAATLSFCKMSPEGFQYLISRHYAVPLWFGINHWANGNTAIDLGIAIEKP